MTQQCLIEKDTESIPQVQQKEVVKTFGNSDSMWNKIHAWLEACKQQKENFTYSLVEYHANVHPDGRKDEYLTTSTTLERPFRNEGDSYGGCWGCGGCYTKEDLSKLDEDLKSWRGNLLAAPYCKEKADGIALRDIKSENIRIFFDDKAKEFYARMGFNLAELSHNLKSIQETPLTDEYITKFERMKFLDNEIHKLEYEILPGIKSRSENAFSKAGTQTILDSETYDLNAALELFKRLELKLQQMKKEYDVLRHELYRW